MKVLVTGGAGYVGTVLTKSLVKLPEVDKIIVYDNLSRKNSNLFLGERLPNADKLQLVVGDILDLRKLKRVLDGVDVVFHLAARVSTPFANVDADFHEQVNHWGTAELVSAVEDSNVKKFIFTSSTSVYGASEHYIKEDQTPEPRTFYGISKHRGEEHVKRLQKKLNAVILRCANVYGYSRSMRFDAVINRFMFDANFTNRIQIHGNGKQYRAFIHVKILIESLIGCLLQEVPSGTYNVIDRNLQILDIVDVLKQIFPSLEFIFINQHLNLRQVKVERNSRIRQYVDFENLWTLEEELSYFQNQFAF
jgi:UDP-glucose 4-epimerase